MIYLGFDSSNYTTSVSAYTDEEIYNIRKILSVKSGERGLRQSDAVFQHLKELPDLYSKLSNKVNLKNSRAVGVSARPRSVDGSYMPVFLAGVGYAKVVADTLNIPLYQFSHQDGHIMAGIHSCNAYNLLEKPFLSVHLSGGTCEILLTKYNNAGFDCKIIGGTKDISAGQLIDRVGVSMGMQFPCGKQLEIEANNHTREIKLPVNTDASFINFSGIETKALSLVNKEETPDLCYSLLIAIAKALKNTLEFTVNKYQIKDILIVGGVSANSIIKEFLKNSLSANLYFAKRELSCDNAVGIALLTKMVHKKTEK